MRRLTTLTLQYYRSLLLYNITFTILCVFLIGLGVGTNPAGFFFSKLIGFAAAAGLHYFSSAKTYFYYRNAGLTIRRLYVYAYLIDVAVFILSTIIFIICRHLF
ncbi:hypothetical protein EWM62_03250 [Mucilaginibacter terrigena]|uniref:Succinate dehydrogenase n=1 Tax=Mucilaginibacter terrigena TaxID=2492395 RepID=A0A4Q5LSB3_9SPHI|nr:hypothetical protein [Mucilaginibacter terrigena]RYU92466.1 hypothetical protein EWM62_03250 [Mucilaginibacter terrigena]